MVAVLNSETTMGCDHCGDCYELLTDVRVLNTLSNPLGERSGITQRDSWSRYRKSAFQLEVQGLHLVSAANTSATGTERMEAAAAAGASINPRPPETHSGYMEYETRHLPLFWRFVRPFVGQPLAKSAQK